MTSAIGGRTVPRGTNIVGPRLRLRTENGQPRRSWAMWCGWCKRDRYYGGSYPVETVINTHDEHKEECRARFNP